MSCVSEKLRLSVQESAIPAERLHLDDQAAAVEAIIPQALRGPHQQLPHDRGGPFDASVFGRQNVLVADARALCLRACDVRAMQKLVHLGAGHAAPDQPQPRGVGVPEGGDIGDAGPLQVFGHFGADARNGPYLQVKDGAGQLLNRQDGQAIGLLHVGSHLGQQLVR